MNSEVSDDIRQKAELILELLGEPVSPYKVYMNGWVKACNDIMNHVPGSPITMNAQLKRAVPIWADYQYGGTVEEKNKMEISGELFCVQARRENQA